MDDKMTWPPYVAALFGVGVMQPQDERGHQKKYFIAFNSSPAHPPFALYNHVLAKNS
jgi:hypothetical protein